MNKKTIRNIMLIFMPAVIMLFSACAGKNGAAVSDGADYGGAEVKRCIGVIRESRENDYVVNLCSDTNYKMLVDKCGTDFEEGTDIKIEYVGAVIHYDDGMNIKERQDFNYLVSDDGRLVPDRDIVLKAEEYKSVSRYDNDYAFYGTVGPITNISRAGCSVDGVAGTDCMITYYPDDTEEEASAREIFGDGFGFSGYVSETDESKTPALAVGDRVKVTYNPETMRVAAIEPVYDE